MNWTRRWGIIGTIALAQLGIIVGYQALLTDGTSAANAGQVAPPKSIDESIKSNDEPKLPAPLAPGLESVPPAPIVPPIAVPPLPSGMVGELPPALPPLPDLKKAEPNVGAIIPVSAQEPPRPLGVPDFPRPAPMEFGSPALPPVKTFSPATNAAGSPWNLSVEIVGGRTRLTAKNGKDVKFSVSCEKLDVQSPKGRIEASGKVQVTSDNLEGTCDRLTISWEEEVVVLDKVQLKCKLQGQDAEVIAEQLRLRLDHIVAAKEKLWAPDEN